MRRIGSYGLAAALVARFADGEWHDLTDAIMACARWIPIQMAVREADRNRQPADLESDFAERQVRGERRIVERALAALGAELASSGGGGRPSTFRLPPPGDGVVYGPKVGAAVPWSKLTPERIREGKRRIAAGETHTAVAREFGVSRSTLRYAMHGETWKAEGLA